MAWLTAAEALATLGVRAQTLYASVSRGRIQAKPDPADPRRSLYNAADVSRLAARHSGRRKSETLAAETIHWGDPILPSAISTVQRGRLYYRGQDVVALAERASLEEVAALLWQVDPIAFAAGARVKAPGGESLRAAFVAIADRVGASLPISGRPLAALRKEAADIVGALADAMIGDARERGAPLHQRIAQAWRCPGAADVIRRALVLLADHELNASTFAARVTASTGASLAACVLAGLSALTGPRHGGAAAAVQAFSSSAASTSGDEAVRDWLARGHAIPAFGHPLYPDGDARGRALLACFSLSPIFVDLRDAGQRATGEEPNVDFALAAMASAHDLPMDAPLILFALARSVGWIAHAFEQAASGDLIRPRARYVGPPIAP